MKSMILLVIGITTIFAAILFNAETDPFGTKSAMHKLSSLNPTVAYAASSSVIDGYQPSSATLVTWHASGDSASNGMIKIQNNLTKDDKIALCSSASEEIQSHPKYKKWCM